MPKQDPAQSYDDKFDLYDVARDMQMSADPRTDPAADGMDIYDLNQNYTIPSYKLSKTPTTEQGRNTGFGESRFDKGFFPDMSLNKDGSGDSLGELITENRAQHQPWISKAGAGLGRVGQKVLTEVAKMPGVFGGMVVGGIGNIGDLITGEDNTDFIKTAFDNSWIKAIDGFEEHVRSEYLPVYVKRAVKNGNLWDNITSIDFWATDGADGVGFIAAMLLPGAAISKFNLGSKLLGVNKFAKMASKVESADEALNILGKAYITPRNANLLTSTVANTTFEAAAESKEAMDSYQAELENRLALSPDDPNYISQAQFDELIGKKSEIGRNVFLYNVAILAGPNAIMSKMLWGKARDLPVGKITVSDAGMLETIANPSLKIKAGRVGKDILWGGSVEGLWEEGMQSTVSNYFQDNPNAGFFDFIGELPKAYVDMAQTTDGQKAMFLGAAFGGGMYGYQNASSRKAERKNANELVTQANNVLTDFYNVFDEDIYAKGEDGQVLYTEGLIDGEYQKRPKIDEKKFIDKLQSTNQLENLSAIYDLAVERGDTKQIRDIKEVLTTHLIKPFVVNKQLGIDVLRQHLENSTQLQNLSEREKVENDKQIADIMDKATKMQKDYERFDEFSNAVFNLDIVPSTKQEKIDFYNRMANQYLDMKARQHYLDSKVKAEEAILDDLLREKGRSRQDIDDNNRLKSDLKTQDIRFERTFKDLDAAKSNYDKVTKGVNAFWDGKSVREAFTTEVAERARVQKEFAENEQATQDTLDAIKNAKTLEELDAIDVPDNVASDPLKATIEDKKKALQKQADEKAEDVTNANDEFEQQQADAYEQVAKNFSEGDVLTVPDANNIPEDHRGKQAKITKFHDYLIEMQEVDDEGNPVGEPFAFQNTQFMQAYNETDGASEGGDTPAQEEYTNEKELDILRGKQQPRVVTTDNNTGTKLDFVDQAAVDFERVPRDKRGEEKGIAVNSDTENNTFTDNQKEALDMFEKGDFSRIDFLIDNLPLNIKLTDTVFAPLETKSDKSEAYNKIFKQTSRPLRETIIKELAQGTNIDNITVPIAGQGMGTLQIESSTAENPLTGLYEFGGKLENIKSSDIFYVDNFNNVKNFNNETLSTNGIPSPGEIYLRIKAANGEPFPLKLNVKKLSYDKANLLYELYKAKFDGNEAGTVLSSLPIWDDVKANFKEELELFNKAPEDVTIKDLIELMVWEGSRNNKTRLMMTKDGRLLLKNRNYTKEQFETQEAKTDFINTLTNDKRHQIRYKRKETDDNNINIQENRKYVEYLIKNGILNTNAKVGEPTFQGKTTMYLAKGQTKVGGTLSKFNKTFATEVKEHLVGTLTNLKKKMPGLFKLGLALNKQLNQYFDNAKVAYNRATTLKDQPFSNDDEMLNNYAVRGDVIDRLTRLYFSRTYISQEEFAEKGKEYLTIENKDKKTSVKLSENFYTSTFSTLQQYQKVFSDLNYTLYANDIIVGGTIGSKGRIAGTIDLLAYDNTNKQWVLIDLKATTNNRFDEYAKEADEKYVTKKGFSYKNQDMTQLNTYRELFKQMTGEEIGALKIMSVTSKPERGAYKASSYDEVFYDEAHPLLDVEMKSIFDILNIKKTEPKKATNTTMKEGLPTTVEHAFDINKINKFAGKEFVKAEPKPTPQEISDTAKLNIMMDTVEAYENESADPFDFEGKEYHILPGYLIMAKEGPIVDKDRALAILKDYSISQFGRPINIKEATTVWNKRVAIKTEEAVQEITQKLPEAEDVIDIDSMPEDEVTALRTQMIQNFPQHVAGLLTILKKGGTNKAKTKEMYEYLLDKDVSRDEIKTKCITE